LLLHNMAYL